MKLISRPEMEPPLPRVPRQQTDNFSGLENASCDQKHSISIRLAHPPNAKPALGSVLTSLSLTHGPFFLSLFLTLYCVKASCLPSYFAFLDLKTACLLHEVLTTSLVSSKLSSFIIFNSYKEQD